MGKNYILSAIIPLFIASLHATNSTPEEPQKKLYAAEITSGYFHPRDTCLRKIFDKKGSKGGYWLEGVMRYNIIQHLYVDARGSYCAQKGCALNSSYPTRVSLPTVGLGLSYYFTEGKKASPFLGAGMRIFFYRENNYNAWVPSVHKTTVGGMLNGGVLFTMPKNLTCSLFTCYNFAKLTGSTKNHSTTSSACTPSCTQSVDLGGFIVGLGLGYRF